MVAGSRVTRTHKNSRIFKKGISHSTIDMEEHLLHLNPKMDRTVCEVDLFDEEGLKLALKQLHWSIRDNFLFDENGQKIVCGSCGDRLTFKSTSAFFPGSVGAVCEKPSCVMLAVYKSRLKRVGKN